MFWIIVLISILAAWWFIAQARRERDIAVRVLVQSESEQAEQAAYRRRLVVAAREAQETASMLSSTDRLNSHAAASAAAKAELEAAALAYREASDDTPARKLLHDYDIHCYEVAYGPVHYRRKQSDGPGVCSLCRAMTPEDVRKAVRYHEAYQALKAVDFKAALEMSKARYRADRDARRNRIGPEADDAYWEWWSIHSEINDELTNHDQGWCPAREICVSQLESKYDAVTAAQKVHSWTPSQIIEIAEAQTETRLTLNELKHRVERELAQLGRPAFAALQAWAVVYHCEPDDRARLIEEASQAQRRAEETSTVEQVAAVHRVRKLAERVLDNE